MWHSLSLTLTLSLSLLFAEMEIIPEGRHFRLVHESELPEILVTLERYLPESLKVCAILTINWTVCKYIYVCILTIVSTSHCSIMCTTATPPFSGNLTGERLHSLSPCPGLYASHAISVPICSKPIAVVDLFLLFTPVSLQFLMPRPRLPLAALRLAFSSRVQVRFVLCTFPCFVLFMFSLPTPKGGGLSR